MQSEGSSTRTNYWVVVPLTRAAERPSEKLQFLRLVRCYAVLVGSAVQSLPQSGESEGRLWQIAERDSRCCRNVSKGEVKVSQSESIISPRSSLVPGHSGLHVVLGKAASF